MEKAIKLNSTAIFKIIVEDVPESQNIIQTICQFCGRALVARYDLKKAKNTFTREEISTRVSSMWRYEELMPVINTANIISLGEGMTQLLPVPNLGKKVGANDLWVKDEGSNPTGTFKARGISAALSKAVELNIKEIGMPTAGNAGSATAAYAARAGIKAHVAMPSDTPIAMMDEVRTYGGTLKLIDGLISDAGAWIAEQSKQNGWFPMATLKEPYRVEGKKNYGVRIVGAIRWTTSRRNLISNGWRHWVNWNVESIQ